MLDLFNNNVRRTAWLCSVLTLLLSVSFTASAMEEDLDYETLAQMHINGNTSYDTLDAFESNLLASVNDLNTEYVVERSSESDADIKILEHDVLANMSAQELVKRKDSLVVISSTEPVSLDPGLINDTISGSVVSNLYESLVRFKHGSTQIEPSLAKSWDISTDGRTYRFYLREGVKFHDGTPFNAKAVKINFDRQRASSMTSNMASYAPSIFSNLLETKVISDYVVELRLKHAAAAMLRNMAIFYGAPIVSPTALANNANDVGAQPVGTGPYRLVKWNKGKSIVMAAFDDYWGDKPEIKHVLYKIIPDVHERTKMLVEGHADIINGVHSSKIQHIRDNGALIFENDSYNTNYLIFNCRPGYKTANLEVRKAIAKAIDLDTLVPELYGSYANIAHSFFPATILQQHPRYKPRRHDYDPDKAAALFKDNQVTSLKILVYDNARIFNAAGSDLAMKVKDYLKEAGIDAQVMVYPWAIFRDKLLIADWDISFLGWNSDNGDPDNFISFLSSNTPEANKGLWQNERFKTLIFRAAHTNDGPTRARLYYRANDILYEDHGVLPISHGKELLAYSSSVQGNLMQFSMVQYRYLSKY